MHALCLNFAGYQLPGCRISCALLTSSVVRLILTVNISSQNPNMRHHTFDEQLNVNDNSRSDTSTARTSGNGSQSSSDGSFHPIVDSSADQPHLFQYVVRMKWKKLCRLLKRKKGDYIEMCKARDSTGLSLFGFAIASGAPNDVLDTILKVDPTQSYSADCFGATPLHIACLNGAPPRAIKYLIKIRGGLVKAKDIDSRVPLHHAVECLARDEISFHDAIDCIQRLFDADSTLIHATDKFSDSPIDLVQIALMNIRKDTRYDALYKLYNFLTELSIKEHKRKKLLWESQGYDTAEEKTTDGTAITARTSSDLSSRITGYSSLQPMETDCFEEDSRFFDRALGLSRFSEKISDYIIEDSAV